MLDLSISSVLYQYYQYFYIIFFIFILIFFTYLVRCYQVLRFKYLVASLLHQNKNSKENVSGFTALMNSMGTRMGAGNVVGVAAAIAIGGPGAVFWMWIFAILSAGISLVECTMAQVYKQRDKNQKGLYVGGAAYYLFRGLKKNFFWIAPLFAIITILTKGFFINIAMINSVVYIAGYTIFGNNFGSGSHQWSVIFLIIIISIAIFLIIAFKLRKIIDSVAIIAPFAILIFLLFGFFVITFHFKLTISVFGSIFKNAFSLKPAIAGGFWLMLITGVQRGVYSNDAGQGDATYGASIAKVDHPMRQGMSQAFGSMFDTIVICSISAIIFLVGIMLVNHPSINHFDENIFSSNISSVRDHPGVGPHFSEFITTLSCNSLTPYWGFKIFSWIMLVIMGFFTIGSSAANTSIIEMNLFFFLHTKKNKLDEGKSKKQEKCYEWIAKLITMTSIVFGVYIVSLFRLIFTSPSFSIFTLGDIFVSFSVVINSIALVFMRSTIKKVFVDFDNQLKSVKTMKHTFSFNPIKLNIINTKAWHDTSKTKSNL